MADTKIKEDPQSILSRIEQDDQGVPYRHGDFSITTEPKKESLPNLLSKVSQENATEEILLM